MTLCGSYQDCEIHAHRVSGRSANEAFFCSLQWKPLRLLGIPNDRVSSAKQSNERRSEAIALRAFFRKHPRSRSFLRLGGCLLTIYPWARAQDENRAHFRGDCFLLGSVTFMNAGAVPRRAGSTEPSRSPANSRRSRLRTRFSSIDRRSRQSDHTLWPPQRSDRSHARCR